MVGFTASGPGALAHGEAPHRKDGKPARQCLQFLQWRAWLSPACWLELLAAGAGRCHPSGWSQEKMVEGSYRSSSFCSFTLPLLVNGRHLAHPPLSLLMIHVHQLIIGPVEVMGDVGHFPVKPVKRVDNHPPKGDTSAAKPCRQWGHVRSNVVSTSSLIQR